MEASDFFVEDLLDLPTGDEIIPDAFFHPSISTDSSSSPSGGPADAHFSPAPHFSGELCVPYDDVAELEWLSNFVEDSFSSHVSNGAPGPNPTPIQIQQSSLRPDGPVPGKARSKLSRVAPSDWTTRLPVGPAVGPNPNKKTAKKRVDYSTERANYGEVRRCLHCASEKTPQWRTGPMGPKTLCNACGVRYKSGRLVAEYRPAASPSFVATKHSNSHRKVVELRRQNENQRHHQQFVGGGGPAGGVYVGGGDDNYLIRHHVGPDFRQLI